VKSFALAALALMFHQFVSGQNAPAESALLQQLPVVEAAALHTQTLEEAPANVTVITAAEIRKYGYRTLAEALAGVRGFYMTNDRVYQYVGVRGFSLPGDYNTRLLVMLNGHPLTENVYASNNFFGQDFGLDMDLVERIEIIRGPTSALYGSNGIFANINIVTRSPVDSAKWLVSSETGSFGEKKALASAAIYLGKGANLLVSASMFNNSGQDLYFPNYDGMQPHYGWVRGADGERGFHTFANLIWRNWSFTAFFNSRQKKPPIAWDDSAIFGDAGAHVQDERNFIGAAYTRDIGKSGKLRWSTYFDQYRYDDRFDYQDGGTVEDLRNEALGDWMDSQLTYSFEAGRAGTLTLGVAGSFEFHNLQHDYAISPNYENVLYVSRPNRQAAVFAQEELRLARKWKAYLGVRFDASKNFDNNVSPRVALVYEHSLKSTWKFVYGRPFRNPSVYEQYFQDGLSLVQAPKLRPETAQTFEASFERRLGREWSAIATGYQYRLNDLIHVVYPNGGLPGWYANSTHDRASGVEGELKGKLRGGIEASVSVALQWAIARGLSSDPLPDSPRNIDKIRIGVPFARGKVFASAAASYMSSRETVSDGRLGPVLLSDFTLTTLHLHPDFDLEAGVRNAFNSRYFDPIGLAVDRIQENGRSVFVKLLWHARE
jgi:outer membrane receptor for ferrienterochelin and colicins